MFSFVSPIQFVFICFIAYTFSVGLSEIFSLDIIVAIIIGAVAMVVILLLKRFIFLKSLINSEHKKVFLLPILDIIALSLGIWGAVVAWDWNIFLAILVFIGLNIIGGIFS